MVFQLVDSTSLIESLYPELITPRLLLDDDYPDMTLNI